MTRIWLNHWFSTAYNIINMIKEGETDFVIIGTNENINSVISCVCDEWYQEPEYESDNYVAYCIDFCMKHKIDIFMPRRGMLEISRNKEKFEAIGTKVMVDDFEIISKLNNKNEAYELFKKLEIGIVPDYRIVSSATEFYDAYLWLKQKYKQVCFKFVHDEGGKSFRLIDNKRKGYEALFKKQNTRMTLDDVMEALKEREKTAPIMVMPYLPSHEISVDCLKTETGLIMLPREKDATRIEKLMFDPQIIGMCEDFYAKVGLEYPCNIQFKYLDGVPYFLEVNTRMSGGVQMACLASGINIPNLAVNKMLGIHKEWKLEKETKLVSHVEVPLVI